MSLEDEVTQELAREIRKILVCSVLNSEGKHQAHDWGDPYTRWCWQRWYWKIWYPVRRYEFRDCVRCGYKGRRLR